MKYGFLNRFVGGLTGAFIFGIIMLLINLIFLNYTSPLIINNTMWIFTILGFISGFIIGGYAEFIKWEK